MSDSLGMVVVTRNSEKIIKIPGIGAIDPFFYWVPEDKNKTKLDQLQWAVEGHIDIVHYREDIMSLWINDEGKLNGSKPSERYPADYAPEGEDILFGDLCITGPVDSDGESSFMTLQEAKDLIHKVPWRVRTCACKTTKYYVSCGVDAGCIALIRSDLVDDNKHNLKPVFELNPGNYNVYLTTLGYNGKVLKQVELTVKELEKYYVADPCWVMKYDTVCELSRKTKYLSEDSPGIYPMNTGGDGYFNVTVYVCEGKL